MEDSNSYRFYWGLMQRQIMLLQTSFATPPGTSPVALDFTGLGKGEAWVNGQSIGRYWPTAIAPNSGCSDNCDYRGNFGPDKCQKNCGKPSQDL